MKRTAILVIAALEQPVYRHYIESYWTALIEHTRAHVPHVDVYLLNEPGRPPEPFAHVADNVIEDRSGVGDRIAERAGRPAPLPGILSKTIHALDVLADRYDVFFRTNLSSMIRLDAFDAVVQGRDDLCYSGAWVWTDALRDDLVAHGWVGPGRSVADLAELDHYPGNTFVSGSGYFLNVDEARHLVDRRNELRFDLPDDVAVGLVLERAEVLPGFAELIRPELTISEMLDRIRTTSAAHVRLEHFPVERARALWRYLSRDDAWR